jgi:hypothetical protein
MRTVVFAFIIVGFLFVFFVLRTIFFPVIDKLLVSMIRNKTDISSTLKTKEVCEKNGGDWGRAGLFPKEICRIKLKDGGNLCFAGFQCEAGRCLTQYRFRKSNFFSLGKCPIYYSVFGCLQEVHFGVTGTAICLD